MKLSAKAVKSNCFETGCKIGKKWYLKATKKTLPQGEDFYQQEQ
jgi:hypothetical protein